MASERPPSRSPDPSRNHIRLDILLGGPMAADEALQPAPFHARFSLTERAQAPKPIRSKRCTRRGSAGGNALRAGVLGVILTAALGLAAAAAHAQTLVPTEWC